jgi:methylthioribose-1-phosphate isomerase
MSGTIRWEHDHPVLIDQTRLPFEEIELHCTSVEQVAEAIASLRVRGAPAIGVAAAYGIALGAFIATAETASPIAFAASVQNVCAQLGATRPTAINLFWAIERMRGVLLAMQDEPPGAIASRLLAEAHRIAAEDEQACRIMGELGAPLIENGAGVLTHCNAGALATAGIGTATAPIFTAHRLGTRLHVFVDETRPLLQGARLTAWELKRAGIPFTLITDNMAASIMRRGSVQAVFVGSDRIASNGDVANKIGTYSVALAARAHDIPFYVVAPTSTVDLATPTGEQIAIEERSGEEVRTVRGCRLVPEDYPVYNPAFDITPASFVTAIITERGIVRSQYATGLAALGRGDGISGREDRDIGHERLTGSGAATIEEKA